MKVSRHAPRKERRFKYKSQSRKLGGVERLSKKSVCFVTFPKSNLFSRHHIIPYGVMKRLWQLLETQGERWNQSRDDVLNKLGCPEDTNKETAFCYLYVVIFSGPTAANRDDDPENDYEPTLPRSMPLRLSNYIRSLVECVKKIMVALDENNEKQVQDGVDELLSGVFSQAAIHKLLMDLSIDRMQDVYPFIISDWELVVSSTTANKELLRLVVQPAAAAASLESGILKQYNDVVFFPLYSKFIKKGSEPSRNPATAHTSFASSRRNKSSVTLYPSSSLLSLHPPLPPAAPDDPSSATVAQQQQQQQQVTPGLWNLPAASHG